MINILKKIREERGMTQEEVAKSSHIALRSYQNRAAQTLV